MPFRLKVKDNGASTVLANAGVRLRVSVGVIGAKAAGQHDGAPPGTTIAEIAEKHELGLGVPERSFLRAYVDANEAEIKKDLRAAFQQILRGKFTPKRAAEILGLRHVGGIQQYIADKKVVPPLSPVTIRIKGSDVPLIDTGQLRSAITHVVEKVLGGRATVLRGTM